MYALAYSVDLEGAVKAFVMLKGVLVSTLSVQYGGPLLVSFHVADRL